MNTAELKENEVINGKSVNRVHKAYGNDYNNKDWKAQFNMLSPDGITCGDCAHSERCNLLFDGKDSNTSCQFHPSRYTPTHKKNVKL